MSHQRALALSAPNYYCALWGERVVVVGAVVAVVVAVAGGAAAPHRAQQGARGNVFLRLSVAMNALCVRADRAARDSDSAQDEPMLPARNSNT